MNDEQLLRYSRHILLPEIGIEGQEKFLASTALIIGAGGLGSPVAMYLAAAGVGTIALADGDAVDLTNLQRQILHTTGSIGKPKAASGREALAKINPEVKVAPLQRRRSCRARERPHLRGTGKLGFQRPLERCRNGPRGRRSSSSRWLILWAGCAKPVLRMGTRYWGWTTARPGRSSGKNLARAAADNFIRH